MFGTSTWVLFLGVIVVGFAVGIVSFTAQCCRNAERQQLIPLSWGLTHASTVHTAPSHAGPTTIEMGGVPMMAVQPAHPGGAARKPDKVQPLPAHMIERLPSFLLEKTALVEEPECSICQEDLAETKVVSLPCGHIFHKACVTDWLRLKATCPTCRLLFNEQVLAIHGDVEQGSIHPGNENAPPNTAVPAQSQTSAAAGRQ